MNQRNIRFIREDYIGFGRVIGLEWGDKRDALCKVCLPN